MAFESGLALPRPVVGSVADVTKPDVHGLVHRHLAPGTTLEPADLDLELAALGLGSLAIVGLITDLERTFAITFPADMITHETFRTLRTVTDSVTTLLAAKAL